MTLEAKVNDARTEDGHHTEGHPNSSPFNKQATELPLKQELKRKINWIIKKRNI